MNEQTKKPAEQVAVAREGSRSLGDWLQDPMGSVVASTMAVIGSFAVVLSGIWFVNLALA